MSDKVFAFAGTSITTNSNLWAFRQRASLHLVNDEQRYQWTFINAARSGNNTWSNLVRLSDEILANNPDVIVFDTANDSNQDWQNATLEAFIRRIWTARPNCQLMAFNFFAVANQNVNANVDSPTNEDAILTTETILAHYGIPLVDYWGRIQELVNNQGHDLNEYMDDTIHPNETGHNEAYSLLLPRLPFGGASMPSPLPAYLYDDGTMENTPTRRNGNANNAETGTWTPVATTGRQSSTVGSTIRFNNVTCSTVGAYRADAVNMTVIMRVYRHLDGALLDEDSSFELYQNGGALSVGYGNYDIEFEVISSIRMDEFWAI